MIRLAICQELIPRYRAPVFDLLGAQDEIDLTVFASGERLEGETARDEPLRFRHVPGALRRLRGPFRSFPALLEAIDPSRFDLAILPWDLRNLNLLAALRRQHRSGPPTVLWGQGYSKRPGRLRDLSRDLVGRRASGVMLYSRTIADGLIARGFDEDRVFVAQNALDQRPMQTARQAWRSETHDLAAFQREHGLDPRQTVIFVSRLFADNRIDMLIEAMHRLRSRRPEARLVVVGDGPARTDLEALAGRLGVADQVVFTGAIFDQMQIAPWMLSSTLFCYPVNIGLSILHAFGYGLPVVTSDDLPSHNPEIEALRPGETGLLYEDGSVDDLVRVWERIMDDEDLRAELGRGAHAAVMEKYTLANMVQGFLDATRLVDGKRRTVHAEATAPEIEDRDRRP